MNSSSDEVAARTPATLGRPRSIPRSSTQDVAEEILDAAARLFTVQGYEGTSTRQIADEVGLKQGSLFHHFSRKSDMMTALLERTMRPATKLVDWVNSTTAPPDAALFMLVRADVTNICSGRVNLASLAYAPILRDPEFDWFWQKRAGLVASYLELVRRGLTANVFACVDLDLTAAQVFGLVESAVFWFERGSWSSDLVAEEVGTSALRIAGVDAIKIADVKQRAAKIADAPPTLLDAAE